MKSKATFSEKTTGENFPMFVQIRSSRRRRRRRKFSGWEFFEDYQFWRLRLFNPKLNGIRPHPSLRYAVRVQTTILGEGGEEFIFSKIEGKSKQNKCVILFMKRIKSKIVEKKCDTF